MGTNSYRNLSAINVNIPSLKDLTFRGELKDECGRRVIIDADEFVKMIELNPQIEGLHLDVQCYSSKLMWSIIQSLLKLQRFSISVRVDNSRESSDEVFHFENLLEYNPNVYLSSFSFGKLERTCLLQRSYCLNFGTIMNFFSKNEHLKTVKFEKLVHVEKLNELLGADLFLSKVEELYKY